MIDSDRPARHGGTPGFKSSAAVRRIEAVEALRAGVVPNRSGPSTACPLPGSGPGHGPSVDAMVFSDPSPRASRLTAVLGPPRPRRPRSAPGDTWSDDVEPVTAPTARSSDGAGRRPTPCGRRAGSPPTVPGGEPGSARVAVGPLVGSVPGRRPGAGRASTRGGPEPPRSPWWPIAAAVLAAVGVWWQRPQAQPVGGLPTVVALAEPGAAGEPHGPAPAAGPAPTPARPPAGPDAANGAAPVGAGTAPAPEPPGAHWWSACRARSAVPGWSRCRRGPGSPTRWPRPGVRCPAPISPSSTWLAGSATASRWRSGCRRLPDAAPAAGPPGPALRHPRRAARARRDRPASTSTRPRADQLDGLPGVGPVTAQRILEWRTRNGRFSQVEQLREIEGIGERRFAQLRELVTV